MQFEIRYTEGAQRDLRQHIAQEDQLALDRHLGALDSNRQGMQLAGPLDECYEIRFLKNYVVTFLLNEQAKKIVVWGIRRGK